MKQTLAIVAGVLVGLALSGVVAPVLIWMLPPRFRGAGVVWSATAVVVALTTSGFWLISSGDGRGD